MSLDLEVVRRVVCDDYVGSSVRVFIKVRGTEKTVAEMQVNAVSVEGQTYANLDEVEKLAKLMAAAPKMLEALEQAVFLLENEYQTGSVTSGELNRLRAAIALAKGETP